MLFRRRLLIIRVFLGGGDFLLLGMLLCVRWSSIGRILLPLLGGKWFSSMIWEKVRVEIRSILLIRLGSR